MSEIRQNVDNQEPIKEEEQYEGRLTANPGDRISEEPESVEEKAKQVAVDSWDIVGHTTVPTYFVVDNPDGSQEALHHVKDADKISDVIRQARVNEKGERVWW